MEIFIDILDSLIKTKKQKKRKEPNTKEKEAFRNAWLGLVSEEGFNGRAEQFLYDGFSFCGAEPFYTYLLQTKDPNATLATLFSGKYYGNDSNTTFRLITHLLALMLNDNAPESVLTPIIKRFPRACINKDKKRLGTAEKTIEKYLLAELKPNAVLIPLSSIRTKPILVEDFAILISAVLDSIESNGVTKDFIADNIKRIRKWIANYKSTQSTYSDKKASQTKNTQALAEDKQSLCAANNIQQKISEKAEVSIEKQPTDMASYLINLLNNAGKAAVSVRSENMQQKTRIDTLVHTVDVEREKLRLANQQIADQQDTITSLRKKLSTLEGEVFALDQEVAKRDIAIAEKNTEIAERTKMIDVLSRDRSKQADETIQRLASRIRVEYRDFADALDIPMSCDLGENLRLQLKNIFDILEKGGMKIK